MPPDYVDHFLKLARRKSPLVPYASRRAKAYYVNAPSAVGVVLRDGQTFRPTMHPFREARAHVAPSGSILLGFDHAPGSFANALIRTRDRTQRFCLEQMDSCRIDGRSFYFCMKELSFLITADLLFDFDATTALQGVGDASDVIEEIRARFGLAGTSKLPSRYATKYAKSFSVLSDAAVLIQLAQDHPPKGKTTHAIVETMLNAFVPISYALIWSMLLLGRDAKTQEAVLAQARVRSSFPSMASKNRLVDRVVRESLRLFPPAWLLGRVCMAAASVDGTRVLPGQFLTICPHAVHRSPMLWTRPNLFDPDRFVARNATTYSYFPFGGGAKVCPAARYVPSMLSIMIEVLIERFSVRTKRFPRPLGLIGLRPGPELDIRIRRRAIGALRPKRHSCRG